MPGAHLMICSAGRRVSPVNLSVCVAGLDDHASQIERVLHELAGLLYCHALLLAELSEQCCILFALGVVLRVDECSLVDILQSPLLCQSVNLVWVSDEDKVCDVVSQNLVGGSQCALLCCFGEHDALLVAFSAFDD